MTTPSPESTGGAGYTFEDSVVAFYLSSLLAEGGTRGLSEAIIAEVFLQRAVLAPSSLSCFGIVFHWRAGTD